MTKSYLINLFLLFLLASCTGSIRTDQVDFTQAFTDGNSKIWMTQKSVSTNGAISYRPTLEQEVWVFYQSGNCLRTNLKKLAQGKGERGTMEFDHENKYLTLIFPKEHKKAAYAFEFTDENQLNLFPLEGSDYTKALELIPFPELN